MSITKEDVLTFQKLYKMETGKEISYAEAQNCAIKLVEIIRLVYRPIKKKDFEKFKNEYQK
jgi:hypothetical protein